MHTTRDLANLLQLMQTSRQSGDLIVEPHQQDTTSWRGQIRLIDGQVTFCQIRDKMDGSVVLRDNTAMRWLMSSERGKLQWSLEEPAPLPDTFLPILPANDEPGRDARSGMDRTNSHSTYPAPQNDIRASQPYSGGQNIRPGAIPKRTEISNKTPGIVLPSRELRQVFSLVDGHRTVEEIVRLLHKSPDSVVRLLNELKAAGLLE